MCLDSNRLHHTSPHPQRANDNLDRTGAFQIRPCSGYNGRGSNGSGSGLDAAAAAAAEDDDDDDNDWECLLMMMEASSSPPPTPIFQPLCPGPTLRNRLLTPTQSQSPRMTSPSATNGLSPHRVGRFCNTCFSCGRCLYACSRKASSVAARGRVFHPSNSAIETTRT